MIQDDSIKFNSDTNYYEILNELAILKYKVMTNPQEAFVLRTEVLKYIFSEIILKTEFTSLVEREYEYQFKDNFFERAKYVHDKIKNLYKIEDSETTFERDSYLYFPSIALKDEQFIQNLVVCDDLMRFYYRANASIYEQISNNSLYGIEYNVIVDPGFNSLLRTKFDKYYLASCLCCVLKNLMLHIEYTYCKTYYSENGIKQQKAYSVIKKIEQTKKPEILLKIIKELYKQPNITIEKLADILELSIETIKGKIKDLSKILRIRNSKASKTAVVEALIKLEPYLKSLIT